MSIGDPLSLLDWKRRVTDLYGQVRAVSSPIEAWERWRAGRAELFRTHPQSPLPPDQRASFEVELFDYDPAYRVIGTVRTTPPDSYSITTSDGAAVTFTRFAAVSFAIAGSDLELQLYWLEGYGGGVFLPFKDATSGSTTYGGGRYLLDTVKGADLGSEGAGLVLDFNFAYNPSCSYDPRWSCPLSPPENDLDIAIEAGERFSS